VEGAQLTSREEILAATRAALNRKSGDSIPAPPEVRLKQALEEKLVEQFKNALEALAGTVAVVNTPAEARLAVDKLLNGRSFLASGAPLLMACGIEQAAFSRDTCAVTEVGITSADYALADTGSLVVFTESHESRLLSLLPPCHIAVIERSNIVPSLDDVFRLRALPGEESSAMIVITGPSRTGDIEMRLVRGVHGPGEIHVVIIDQAC
jgi:L-lactate dehydrogenase complex protein LldG